MRNGLDKMRGDVAATFVLSTIFMKAALDVYVDSLSTTGGRKNFSITIA